jgi:acetyl-CoA C-acetyltransferase
MTVHPDRRPVLVGVGACTDRVDPVELMVRAARSAAEDAGAASLLDAIEVISIPRGTWGAKNPAGVVAARLGVPAARTVIADVGVPQQTLVSNALGAIRRGDASVVLVVGAEARVWASELRRNGAEPEESDHPTPADSVLTPERVIVSQVEIAARFWEPVQQYAAIEQALLYSEHGDVADIDGLWARFSDVASRNPHAAFPEPRTPDDLRSPSGGNRMLAAPYRKWHSTQWNLDQASALLLCSESVARTVGVERARVLHPLVALESSFQAALPERREIHRWPAMRCLGEAAVDALGGRTLDSIEYTELYSCFPAAVRVQQRELALPRDGTPTITGGMPFAGGPFNHFTYQATVAMAERLRSDPGTLGMITTVSGLLTKPGLMIWSTEPTVDLVVADLAEQASAATDRVALASEHSGPVTVVAATALFDGEEPVEAIVVGENVDGLRCVARSEEADVVAAAASLTLVGASVAVATPGSAATP